MAKKGLLFVVSGPSGAGKGTICYELSNQRDDIMLSISMTTRSPRHVESEGKSYYFVSREAFQKIIEEDGFLEYAEVYGNYYGTPKSKVMEAINKGIDVVLEIDIQGALQVKSAYPEAIFVFILPPSMKELRKRITGRGTESEDSINQRIGETLKEVAYIDKYDYCIVNDIVEVAVEKLRAIMRAEHSKVSEDIYELIEEYKKEEY